MQRNQNGRAYWHTKSSPVDLTWPHISMVNCCINVCMETNKCTNHSFSLLIIYGSSYMFRNYIAILRERSQSLLRDAQLRKSRKYCGWACCVYWRGACTTSKGSLTRIQSLYRLSYPALQEMYQGEKACDKTIIIIIWVP
jgi:hypothetical protein